MKFEVFPELESDERSVLQRRAACKYDVRSGWKTGRLFLTSKRLLFAHESRFVLEISYLKLTDIRIKARLLALRRRKVLALAWDENNGGGRSRVWLAISGLSSVAAWLSRMTAIPLGTETVHQIVSQLGESGRMLVRHLSKNRHSPTGQLAELLGVRGPMEVARRIEDEVNAAARRVVGRDLVVFRELWFDPETGESFRSSWWLTSVMDSFGLEAG